MSHGKRFSDADDDTISRMRREGATWDAITLAIGHSCKVIIRDHAYRCNLVPRSARQPARSGAGVVAYAATLVYAPTFAREHDVMPAFHPTSWGAIWHDIETRP